MASMAKGSQIITTQSAVDEMSPILRASTRFIDRAPVKGDLWLKPLHPDCCYGYKALVLPDYRGQRLNKTVRSFYDDQMVAMGVKRIIGYIDLHNLRSMRAHERWRQDKVGIAGYFGRSRMWATFRTPKVREYLLFTRQQAR